MRVCFLSFLIFCIKSIGACQSFVLEPIYGGNMILYHTNGNYFTSKINKYSIWDFEFYDDFNFDETKVIGIQCKIKVNKHFVGFEVSSKNSNMAHHTFSKKETGKDFSLTRGSWLNLTTFKVFYEYNLKPHQKLFFYLREPFQIKNKNHHLKILLRWRSSLKIGFGTNMIWLNQKVPQQKYSITKPSLSYSWYEESIESNLNRYSHFMCLGY